MPVRGAGRQRHSALVPPLPHAQHPHDAAAELYRGGDHQPRVARHPRPAVPDALPLRMQRADLQQAVRGGHRAARPHAEPWSPRGVRPLAERHGKHRISLPAAQKRVAAEHVVGRDPVAAGRANRIPTADRDCQALRRREPAEGVGQELQQAAEQSVIRRRMGLVRTLELLPVHHRPPRGGLLQVATHGHHGAKRRQDARQGHPRLRPVSRGALSSVPETVGERSQSHLLFL